MTFIRRLVVLRPQSCLVSQFAFKNTKTARNKSPHEAKSETKWTTQLRGVQMEEEILDKRFLERKIVDQVWLVKEYAPQLLSIEDAIRYHKELAQPEMHNNLDGFLSVRLTLDMSTKKKNKFMENIKGVVYYPHNFQDGIQKEVIAICKKDEEIRAATEAGALFAGFDDVLKKIEQGEITDQSYEFLVCTPETFPDVMVYKKKINKDKLPTLRNNMITENIGDIVMKLHLSKDLVSNKIRDDKAIVKTKIGQLKLEVPQLVENLAALVEKVRSFKRYGANEFISSCVLYAAPSTEKFSVDLSRFNTEEEAEETSERKKKGGKRGTAVVSDEASEDAEADETTKNETTEVEGKN